MTDEQKQKYLNNPNFCPYCESQNFDRLDTDSDSSALWYYWVCDTCQGSWTEEYVLTNVFGN